MNKFKTGDVVYHKAGGKLLGTMCGEKDNKVIVRRVDTLMEVEIFPEELKSQAEVDQEHSEMMATLNSRNQNNWSI